MRVITEPTVRLVSRPRVDTEALAGTSLELFRRKSQVDDNVFLVAAAAKTCYQSFESGRHPNDTLRNLIEQLHGSVLEHVNFSFIVEGVSRDLTHELVRHRHLSYSQLSQRFVDHSDVGYVLPPWLRESYDAYRKDVVTASEAEVAAPYCQWMESVKSSHEAYVGMVYLLKQRNPGWQKSKALRKKIMETARTVLPGSTETKIFVTANVRALRALFEKRCSEQAAGEIRRMGSEMFMAVGKEFPAAFADYALKDLQDGTFSVETEYPRV